MKEDFQAFPYLYTFLFLISCISINYIVDFEGNVVAPFDRKPQGILVYFVYYAFAYYSISIPQLLFLKRKDTLTSAKYWGRSAFFIFVVAFSSSFYLHHLYHNPALNHSEHYYFRKIAAQLKPLISTFLPLLIFWWIYDRNKGNLYGLSLKATNLKPYWVMLAGMSVLVFSASFGDDFQSTYPIFKPWRLGESTFSLSDLQSVAIFEATYGFSFFAVELLFRGALIIGMAHLLGKDAILPMVSMYAFLHFGKPLGETVGSVFGGYILGVIALHTRHILGGCIIHMGVAYMMELFAWWQYLR